MIQISIPVIVVTELDVDSLMFQHINESSFPVTGPSQSPAETTRPQYLDLDQPGPSESQGSSSKNQRKTKKGNKTRETYRPRIVELKSVLEQTNHEVDTRERTVEKMHCYLI